MIERVRSIKLTGKARGVESRNCRLRSFYKWRSQMVGENKDPSIPQVILEECILFNCGIFWLSCTFLFCLCHMTGFILLVVYCCSLQYSTFELTLKYLFFWYFRRIYYIYPDVVPKLLFVRQCYAIWNLFKIRSCNLF